MNTVVIDDHLVLGIDDGRPPDEINVEGNSLFRIP